METKILAAADMAKIVEHVGRDALMDMMIDRVRSRFVEHDPESVDARARDGFRYDKPALGLIEWMPTHEVGGPVVIKMVGYHPTNPTQRNLPSVIATSSMWDTETGHLLVIADATLLTALRTGAASGIATDLLAKPGDITVGIIGLGAQAVTQAHAISRVRPITKIIGFDTNEATAESYAERVGFLGVPVEVIEAEQVQAMVASVDVLCTCTSIDIGAGPLFRHGPTKPWLHVNAVGADFPGKVELPRDLLLASSVFPDTRAQCVAEGECQLLEPEAIGPELEQLCKDPNGASAWQQTSTVFDSTGWAVEDDVALRLALELAQQHDVGADVELEWLSADPYNPYGAPKR